MKWADIKSHKNDDETNIQNYRPISILPFVSKSFEKLMYEDTSLDVSHFLSPYLSGFRKGYSSHSMIIMLEKMENSTR